MKFQADAALLKRLCRIFHNGTYSVAFHGHLGDHDYVTVSGYDGFKYMRAAFDADVFDAGEIVIPARYLSLIPYLEGTVVMSCLAKDISLRDRDRQFHIPSEVPEGPYLMPERPSLGSITVDLKEMKTLIKRVRFATGLDEKVGYDCVLLRFGDQIEAVGCDRRTVAIAKMPQGSSYRGKFLLPKKGLEAISNMEGDMVTLTFHPNGVGLSITGEIMFDIYVPERGSQFLAYESILEVPVNTVLECQQAELASVLADMRLVSDKVAITCNFQSYMKQRPRFRSRDENNAAVERYLKEGDWSGKELKIQVNGKVVEQAVEHITGMVTFGFSNSGGAFSIVSEDKNFMASLLPYSGGEDK